MQLIKRNACCKTVATHRLVAIPDFLRGEITLSKRVLEILRNFAKFLRVSNLPNRAINTQNNPSENFDKP